MAYLGIALWVYPANPLGVNLKPPPDQAARPQMRRRSAQAILKLFALYRARLHHCGDRLFSFRGL